MKERRMGGVTPESEKKSIKRRGRKERVTIDDRAKDSLGILLSQRGQYIVASSDSQLELQPVLFFTPSIHFLYLSQLIKTFHLKMAILVFPILRTQGKRTLSGRQLLF